MFFRRWFVVTVGGIISGMDSVLLMALALEVDTDPDFDCGGIGIMAVMNSVVSIMASWLVHEVAVERVTKHPPGSTNFASGMDEELSLLQFIFIFFSITANPSCSETSSAIDRSSSLLSRIKLANDVVTAATKGAFVRCIFDFEFEFTVDLVSGTVSNSRSSVTVPFPSAFVFVFAFAVVLLFGDVIVVGFGRTRMVSRGF